MRRHSCLEIGSGDYRRRASWPLGHAGFEIKGGELRLDLLQIVHGYVFFVFLPGNVVVAAVTPPPPATAAVTQVAPSF